MSMQKIQLMINGQTYYYINQIQAGSKVTLVIDGKEYDIHDDKRITLLELRPGAVFVTDDGVYAVKSEYRYSSHPTAQCECILLDSGEYAHFTNGNQTMVREVQVK
ncbi:hypothetical protein ccbrp13_55970 [Ktedonobacteria bacterium brp13]|nr:hypothetical protein ccbrp13_55970 [Ktedonobacteria bacterium brp13]